MHTLILTGLVSAVEESYTPKPQVEIIKGVGDYKSIVEPVTKDIHHHSKPLCFRFLLDKSTEKAVLHYRHTTPEKWLPSGAGLELLEVGMFLSLIPRSNYLAPGNEA